MTEANTTMGHQTPSASDSPLSDIIQTSLFEFVLFISLPIFPDSVNRIVHNEHFHQPEMTVQHFLRFKSILVCK